MDSLAIVVGESPLRSKEKKELERKISEVRGRNSDAERTERSDDVT